MFDLDTRRGRMFANVLLVAIVVVLYPFMDGDWATRLLWAIAWGMAYWVLITMMLWGWGRRKRKE